jgi:hypothetical protein
VRVDMARCFTVEFARAKQILMDAAYMVDLRRKPGSSCISVRCPNLVGSSSGGWNGQDGCWLRQS